MPKSLTDAIHKNPLIYITRDVERALGLSLKTAGYMVISNETDISKDILGRHPSHVFLIPGEIFDTDDLLQNKRVESFINDIPNNNLVVFKNTPRTERIAKSNGWKLLNPSAELANIVEQKVSQSRWLGELATLLPKHHTDTLENITWENEPFILQYNHSHSGGGTFHISTQEQLAEQQEKFPRREVRVTEYIKGPVFTSNNVVTTDDVMLGNVSYQVTGEALLTDKPFATVGTDWTYANSFLRDEESAQIRAIATRVGKKLREAGWKGLFGIDCIFDTKRGHMSLLEINARQPASAAYESKLQNEVRIDSDIEITLMEAHFMSLMDIATTGLRLTPITRGGRLISRKHVSVPLESREGFLDENGKLSETAQTLISKLKTQI